MKKNDFVILYNDKSEFVEIKNYLIDSGYDYYDKNEPLFVNGSFVYINNNRFTYLYDYVDGDGGEYTVFGDMKIKFGDIETYDVKNFIRLHKLNSLYGTK